MTVRRETRRDPETGAMREFWIVDVVFQPADRSRPKRIRRVPPLQTRRGAEQYERQLREALLSGTYDQEERTQEEEITFAEFAKVFVSKYAEANNKPSEIAAKNWMLRRHLTPHFGKMVFAKIGSEDIEAYKAKQLKAGLAAKTVHNHLACLSRMFNVALEWGRIQVMPKIRPVKVPKPDFDFLDFEEAKRLATASEGLVHAMVVVALNTGLRIGEMRALRWEDVDLVTGRIVVRRSVYRHKIGTPKGGHAREVPLNPDALKALKAHRHLRGELVFCKANGDMLSEAGTYGPLALACKRAGLRTVAWHVLRHTFASHLVMRGQPVKAVQELLGHATIEMTMRYAHLSPDVRRDAVNSLSETPLRQHHGNGNQAAEESGGESTR